MRRAPRRAGLCLLVAGLVVSPFAPARVLHAHAATSSVQILKDPYTPQALSVAVGDTVTWTNADTTTGNGHTVTSSGRGPLKSSSMSQGGSFSYTFTSAGTFAYYCAIHPDMTGTVTVR